MCVPTRKNSEPSIDYMKTLLCEDSVTTKKKKQYNKPKEIKDAVVPSTQISENVLLRYTVVQTLCDKEINSQLEPETMSHNEASIAFQTILEPICRRFCVSRIEKSLTILFTHAVNGLVH